MLPTIEIFCLIKLRNAETINRFLNRYIDRADSEDRGDEKFMICKLDAVDPRRWHDYEWEPAITLSHIIQRGLDYPPRCFFVYLKSKQTELRGVIVRFTTDNQLILGLCIDDLSTDPKNLEKAKELLSLLGEDFNGHRGLIVVDEPPPENEEIFKSIRVDSHRLCLYSCVWHK